MTPHKMKRGNEGVIISFYYYNFEPSGGGFTILLANHTEGWLQTVMAEEGTETIDMVGWKMVPPRYAAPKPWQGF